MKYTVRPTGHLQLLEKGLAKMYRDTELGREEVGDYKNALLPHGGKNHRVFFDSTKRRYDIDLSLEELKEIALELNFVDPKTKQVITDPNPKNEHCPFFKHLELTLDVQNGGLTLDDETAWGKFWLAAIRAEPKLFNIDDSTDNPLVKKNQMFKVTTASHTEKEFSEVFTEGEKATGIYHAIKNDLKRMVEVCRVLDIVVGENPDIEMIRQAIYLKITVEKDFKTADGLRNIEKFIAINDMSEDERMSRAMITEAKGLGIITMRGRRYIFEDVELGTSSERAYKFFQREDKADLKALLISRVKEARGEIKVKTDK